MRLPTDYPMLSTLQNFDEETMVAMMETAGYKMVLNRTDGLTIPYDQFAGRAPFALKTPQGHEFVIPKGKQTSPTQEAFMMYLSLVGTEE